MLRKDDRPSGGRPSLLSAEQQAEADRHRILSSLDNKPGAKPAAAPTAASAPPPKGRNGLVVWGTVGVGVLAVVGGALAWMASTPDDEAAAVASAPAPAPASVASATPAAAAAAPAEPEVSTAAILEETAAVSPPAEGKLPALKEMLEGPSKPASGHDELKQALERPSAKAPAVAHADRKPEHKTEKVKLAQKAAAKEKAVAKAEPKQPDNDVTLLAALMAHLQSRPPVKKTSTPADQLKTCKQYNAAGEEQCRARLCAADAKKEPECKVAPIAKASSDS